jgi:phosphoserine aminotransferase
MQKPQNPCFSSGPCAKRPGWSVDQLDGYAPGRSHRSTVGKAKLARVLTLSREVLQIPDDWKIGIVPASDTGAIEMAMWSMLGARGVEMLAWESFGKGWVTDVVKQLQLSDVKISQADYGELPDLSTVDFDRDVVFTWNGTTSGVRVPDGDWIADDRAGLTICDATSAAFAMDLPWQKLDVMTYSWQKVMGGEGGHGVIVLSPRAVERLESYTPDWPLPKIFRMTKGGKLIDGIFTGATINTPSMLAVEDALDGLLWAKDNGGLDGLMLRTQRNADAVNDWVARTDWIDHLALDADHRSITSMCLKIVDPRVNNLSEDDQRAVVKKITAMLDKENVAYDIGGYADAPPGLRLWAGATVETDDLEAMFPWLDQAFEQVISELD